MLDAWHLAMMEFEPLTIPNIITLFRLVLVPVIVWLIVVHQEVAAFILFVIAGVSDGADGYLAKRFGWVSELGAYLDPLADKALIVGIFVTLALANKLPLWLVIAVVFRDLAIVGGIVLAWILERPIPIRPALVSKANTVAQIGVAALALANDAFDLGWGGLQTVLIWLTGALTLVSLVYYLDSWLRHMSIPIAPDTH